MAILKKFGRIYIIILSIMFIMLFFTTILSYFNVINNSIVKVLKLTIPILSILIGSFILGKNSIKKGYLQGLYLSISFIGILFLINLIFFTSFNLKLLVYYLIIMITSIFGSMIGTTKRVQLKS